VTGGIAGAIGHYCFGRRELMSPDALALLPYGVRGRLKQLLPPWKPVISGCQKAQVRQAGLPGPERSPGGTAAQRAPIQLQRAALPRILDRDPNPPVKVQPRTVLLPPGPRRPAAPIRPATSGLGGLGSSGDKVMSSVEAPASVRARMVAVQSGAGLSTWGGRRRPGPRSAGCCPRWCRVLDAGAAVGSSRTTSARCRSRRRRAAGWRRPGRARPAGSRHRA